MRYTIILLILFLASCDYGSFDKDKRQILAKDKVRSKLPPHSTDFDITAFKEDTLTTWPDSNIKHPIRYTLNYKFSDSTNTLQSHKAEVIFAPDGHSIIANQ